MTDLIITTRKDLQELIRDSVRDALKEERQSNPPVENKRYLTVDEAAEYVGLAKQTMYGFRSTGEIPSIKPAKIVFFLIEDLDKWMMDSRRKSNKEIIADIERRDSQ